MISKVPTPAATRTLNNITGPSEFQKSMFSGTEMKVTAKPPTMMKPMMPKLNSPP